MVKHWITTLATLAIMAGASAQWDPTNGDWGKDDPRDFRVMTWNVLDGVRSGESKNQDGLTQWAAIARIVAAMKPDVLILQETGDNSPGGGVDATRTLETVCDMLLYGGVDVFNGNQTIDAWVQKYDATFDLPHVYVSSETDGFNRNIILSRYPFADVNGDGVSRIADISTVQPDAYAPGGDGGIRGFMFTEIDLPDADYGGDVVVGNAHLKAGGNGSDYAQRLLAAQNVAYYMDYLFNGAGTGVPDPNNKISGANPTSVLGAMTPWVIGGDWNEDEASGPGTRGPAAWLTQAEFLGSTDGTDRDRSDAQYDDARNPLTNSRNTRGSSKLDYIAWQDEVATLRRAFILDSRQMTIFSVPPEMDTTTIGVNRFIDLSAVASDHLPVIADLILPAAAPMCTSDLDGDLQVNGADLAILLAQWGGGAGSSADLTGDGTVDGADLAVLLSFWGPC